MTLTNGTDREAAIDALVGRMSLAQKAGTLLVARVVAGEGGELWEGRSDQSAFGFTATSDLLEDRHISHVALMNARPPEELAHWSAALQERASTSATGIPVSVAADPMHGRERNPLVAVSGGGFTRLPEPIGLAAAGSPALVEEAAAMMGSELRAAGTHIALHPMADLATEPRWPRVSGTFGAEPAKVSRFVAAYITGLQAEGVAATVKHFPGGGAQRGGEDAHFEAGAHTTFPGGRFEDHLGPFAAAVDAGVARVMPGYAAPLGIDADEVGYAFQRGLVTDILRGRLGFAGVVVSDFNVVRGMRLPRMGLEFPARAWGVEHLGPYERVARLFHAGVDQLGGEDDPGLIVGAVERGLLSEGRVDESVRRVLREKFRLGLLGAPIEETPPPDSRERLCVGERVQRSSLVALQGSPHPFGPGTRVYSEGMDPAAFEGRATVVGRPEDADLAIFRLLAPHEPREGLLEGAFHFGSLEFPAEGVERIAASASLVPTVVDVFLERPAILTPLAALPVTLIGSFGVDDGILLDAVAGRSPVSGTLPFEIPRSMAAVRASREDVPGDTPQPAFPEGHGLVWSCHGGKHRTGG